MIIVYHRISERIVLIGEFQHGACKLRSLGKAEPFGERTCRNIAYDDLERNYLNCFDGGLPFGKLLNKVGGNALFLQHLHYAVGDGVIDNALSGYCSLFLPVECGRIILIIHDVNIGYIGCKDLFCLALIELNGFLHSICLLSVSFLKQ